jgi:hypothetical protein
MRSPDGSIDRFLASDTLGMAQGIDYASVSAAENDNQTKLSVNYQGKVIG